MEVIVSGTVRAYAPHGSYQLQVKEMRKAGLGEKFLLLLNSGKSNLLLRGVFLRNGNAGSPLSRHESVWLLQKRVQ